MKIYIFKKKHQKINDWHTNLSTILSRDYNINDYNLFYNEDGKPFLKDFNLYFNVSHSGSLTVIGVSSFDLGVDLEIIKERKFIEKIVNKVFNNQEKEEFEKKTDEEQINYFSNIWTKKEAYTKLIGTGMKKYFQNVPPDYDKYIETLNISIEDNYYLSIATFNNDERINYKIIYE